MNIVSNTLNKEMNLDDMVKLFESIIGMSEDGLYVCDKDGRTLLVNDALIKITNIDADTFYSYSLHELIEKRILPDSCAFQTLQTKAKQDMIIKYYGGKKAVLTSTPVFDHKGEIFCIVSNVRDITELNNLHQKLEESHRQNVEYRNLLFHEENTFDSNFLYKSKSMEKNANLAAKLSQNDSPILLLGESGVGKDVLAKYIHQQSERVGQFVRINCGAIPAHLIESELFGYEKGAFTGANTSKVGLFEVADQGTIFLDEIGDMPYELQVKLLNVIEEKKLRRVGGDKTISVDIRIIAATNLDLAILVEKGEFRRDLYYRLNVLPIHIPPLRKRKDDIPILTYYFLRLLNEKYGTEKQIDMKVIEQFLAYHWPGNVRELNNIVERMYHMSDDDVLLSNLLPEFIREQQVVQKDVDFMKKNIEMTLNEALEQFEKDYIESVIRHHPTLKDSAETLGVSLSTLMRRKRKFGI